MDKGLMVAATNARRDSIQSLDPISAWAQTVNWNAWGPILSLVAILWAFWLAGASARDARRRDAAKIEAIYVLAGGLMEIFATRALTEADDPADAHRFDSFQNLRKFSEAVVITDLPTATTVDAFMRVATRVQIVHSAQLSMVSGRYPREDYRKECAHASIQMGSAMEDLLNERLLVLHPLTYRFRRKPKIVPDFEPPQTNHQVVTDA